MASVGAGVVGVVTASDMVEAHPFPNRKAASADGYTACCTGYDAACPSSGVDGHEGEDSEEGQEESHF